MKTMQANKLNIKPLILALFAAGVLTACGGGGGGDPVVDSGGGGGTGGGGTGGGGTGGGGTGGGGTQAPSLTMSCPDAAPAEQQSQCSGGTVLKTDNGVMLTRSGVQVFGISASDLPLDAMLQPVPPGTNTGNPRGFALPSAATTPLTNAVAEVRLLKNAATNDVTRVGLLLNGFGLSWDGTNPRPPIIETFATARSRVELDSAGALSFVTLPPGTDTTFFNRTTQANYANNTYFPTTAIKPNLQGAGLGGWRTVNGTRGDIAETGREHQDGDVDAPSATAPTGTKGFRGFTNIAYEFANIAAWNSQDTVNIADWLTQPKVEHNKERRGIVTFGNVTSPDNVPTTGSATYTGTVFGLHGLPAPQDDPNPIIGNATVTVDYAAGTVSIAISNLGTANDDPSVPLDTPSFTATANKGTVANASAPNYFTGAVSATGLTGGVSGRYFGPDAKEVGGTFQLAGPNDSVIIGGFIARKP